MGSPHGTRRARARGAPRQAGELGAAFRIRREREPALALLLLGVTRPEIPAGAAPGAAHDLLHVVDTDEGQRGDQESAVALAGFNRLRDSLRKRASACARQGAEPSPSSRSVSSIRAARPGSPRRSKARANDNASLTRRWLSPS